MNFFKKDFEHELVKAIDASDLDRQRQVLREGLAKDGMNSETAYRLLWHVVVSDLPFEDVLYTYVTDNPSVLHPAQVALAFSWARRGKLDQCTSHARSFLAKFKTDREAAKLLEDSVWQHQLGRAFLFLTAAYSELGARSYSIRALQHGLSWPISAKSQTRISEEIHLLQREIETSEGLQKDKKWEAFFNFGRDGHELYELCHQSGYPLLAVRVQVMDNQYKTNPQFSLSPDELFQEVMTLTQPIRASGLGQQVT